MFISRLFSLLFLFLILPQACKKAEHRGSNREGAQNDGNGQQVVYCDDLPYLTAPTSYPNQNCVPRNPGDPNNPGNYYPPGTINPNTGNPYPPGTVVTPGNVPPGNYPNQGPGPGSAQPPVNYPNSPYIVPPPGQ